MKERKAGFHAIAQNWPQRKIYNFVQFNDQVAYKNGWLCTSSFWKPKQFVMIFLISYNKKVLQDMLLFKVLSFHSHCVSKTLGTVSQVFRWMIPNRVAFPLNAVLFINARLCNPCFLFHFEFFFPWSSTQLCFCCFFCFDLCFLLFHCVTLK